MNASALCSLPKGHMKAVVGKLALEPKINFFLSSPSHSESPSFVENFLSLMYPFKFSIITNDRKSCRHVCLQLYTINFSQPHKCNAIEYLSIFLLPCLFLRIPFLLFFDTLSPPDIRKLFAIKQKVKAPMFL